MSPTAVSNDIPAAGVDAKHSKPEEVEETTLPIDDPEKAAAYRISETEISPEQRKEETRIMLVSSVQKCHANPF
jgi:hypothetical protein